METPHAKELLKKMQKLEESQEHLKQEMSRLKVSTELKQRSRSASARRNIGAQRGGRAVPPRFATLHRCMML